MGVEVDYQVAAPAETRTPNLHRAKIAPPKSADGRMAAEAKGLPTRPLDGNHKTCLTQIGLLMEGLGRSNFAFPGRAYSGRKSIESRAGEAYDGQVRGPNQKSQLFGQPESQLIACVHG